jgi:putative phosphoserine phosphatase/1-acylglycerol-3-phosphate O-acyltransferase
VFVDLDRTLLRGASGPVLGRALREVGLLEGPGLPGEGLLYAAYDLLGESLATIGLVRLAALRTRGWPEAEVQRAGELAAPTLAGMVQPYAPAALAAHRAAGRQLVLATTSPEQLVRPLARLLDFDDVVATRYQVVDGRLTGGLDGELVWGLGKWRAVTAWARARGVDLRTCWAYSDAVFDAPLLGAVGNPRVVHPDPRLRLLARAVGWPEEPWDRPPGVLKVGPFELADLLRPVLRPEAFPYARFVLEGLERVPGEGPVLLAANHRSYFDVVALALVVARLGRPARFLAKQELFDAPVVGPLARALGGIPVDRRGDPAAALEPARRALEAGEIVVVTPEGTIPRGRAFYDPVLRGKTGCARLAAATGAPVVPVGLFGTEAVWPRSARLPRVTQVLDPPLVQVKVGRPLRLAAEARRDPEAATARLMAAISRLLPPEARQGREPTPEEVALATPPGRASA